jgi:class 3 adenylate cyclase
MSAARLLSSGHRGARHSGRGAGRVRCRVIDHTSKAGEVEVRGDDSGGIAVSIARRVCDTADEGRVFVSSVLPPLVAGSPIEFFDWGEHELTDVPERWRLYSVKSG